MCCCRMLWDKFPKFALGFFAVSLIITILSGPWDALTMAQLDKVQAAARSWFFTVCRYLGNRVFCPFSLIENSSFDIQVRHKKPLFWIDTCCLHIYPGARVERFVFIGTRETILAMPGTVGIGQSD